LGRLQLLRRCSEYAPRIANQDIKAQLDFSTDCSHQAKTQG
jgi:hypothetical protein